MESFRKTGIPNTAKLWRYGLDRTGNRHQTHYLISEGDAR